MSNPVTPRDYARLQLKVVAETRRLRNRQLKTRQQMYLQKLVTGVLVQHQVGAPVAQSCMLSTITVMLTRMSPLRLPRMLCRQQVR